MAGGREAHEREGDRAHGDSRAAGAPDEQHEQGDRGEPLQGGDHGERTCEQGGERSAEDQSPRGAQPPDVPVDTQQGDPDRDIDDGSSEHDEGSPGRLAVELTQPRHGHEHQAVDGEQGARDALRWGGLLVNRLRRGVLHRAAMLEDVPDALKRERQPRPCLGA